MVTLRSLCSGRDAGALARFNSFYPPLSATARQPLAFDDLIDDVLREGGLLIGERHFKARHLENEGDRPTSGCSRRAGQWPSGAPLAADPRCSADPRGTIVSDRKRSPGAPRNEA